MRWQIFRLEAVALLGMALPLPCLAQFNQYTAPGSFQERPVSKEEQLDQAIDEAPWSLGRFFLEPWIGISDFAYVDVGGRSQVGSDSAANGRQPDLTLTLGAGIRIYCPVASDFVFEAHFLPAYVWFRDQSDRRRLNGQYGLGLFGDLGRTDLEVSVSRNDEARFLSNELQRRASQRNDKASAGLQVELVSGVAIFGSASRLEVRLLEDAAPLSGDPLDRDEDVYRAGIRFRSRRGFQLGLALEDSEVVFTDDRFDRSNYGVAPVVELGIGGERLWLAADVAFRSLDPLEGSQFVAFEGPTGSAWLSWNLRTSLELQLSGGRDLAYSITETWAYFVNERFGIGLRTGLGSGSRLKFFAERGQDDYIAVVSDIQPRIDDFDSYGTELEIELTQITLAAGWTRTVYESSLPEFDRRVDEIKIGAALGLGIWP